MVKTRKSTPQLLEQGAGGEGFFLEFSRAKTRSGKDGTPRLVL